jgi:hypothetical protein
MIVLPFHNHYKGCGEPTAEVLRDMYRREEVYLKEFSCLCKPQTNLDFRVVLIHGARDIADICYENIRERITSNPHNWFFIFALSFGFGTEVLEKLGMRIGNYPNYRILVSPTMEKGNREMIQLAKEYNPRI